MEVFKHGDAALFLARYGEVNRVPDDGKVRGIVLFELVGSIEHALNGFNSIDEYIPPQTLDGIASGRLKLLFWHGWDAEDITLFSDRICHLFGGKIPLSNFAYSSGSLTPRPSCPIRTWSCPMSETMTQFQVRTTSFIRPECWVALDDLDDTHVPDKVLCLNRTMSHHKIGWLSEMEYRHLLNRFVYSTGPITPDTLQWSHCHFGFRTISEHLKASKFLDVRSDIEPFMGLYPKWPWLKTCMSFINESLVDDNNNQAITEKTFNAMAQYHPFVILGCYGTLRRLKEWGYQTFSSLWDESYDDIVDHNLRFQAVINLIESLLHRDDLPDLIRAARNITISNHDRLLTRDTTQQARKVLKEMIEWGCI